MIVIVYASAILAAVGIVLEIITGILRLCKHYKVAGFLDFATTILVLVVIILFAIFQVTFGRLTI